MLAVGLFASKIANPAGADGLIYGGFTLLGVQALAVLAVAAYSAGVTFGLVKVLDLVMGLRVREEEEAIGLDHTQHRESAYTLMD